MELIQNTSANTIIHLVSADGGDPAVDVTASTNLFYYYHGSTAYTPILSASVNWVSLGEGAYTWAHKGGMPTVGDVQFFVRKTAINLKAWQDIVVVASAGAKNAKTGVSAYPTEASITTLSADSARLVADTLLLRNTSAAASAAAAGVGDADKRRSLLNLIRFGNNKSSIGPSRIEIFDETDASVATTLSITTDPSALPVVVIGP